MDEYYNEKQAMERLDMFSINAFRQLTRKYPDIFENVNTGVTKEKVQRYYKAKVDKFAEMRKLFSTGDETR